MNTPNTPRTAADVRAEITAAEAAGNWPAVRHLLAELAVKGPDKLDAQAAGERHVALVEKRSRLTDAIRAAESAGDWPTVRRLQTELLFTVSPA